MNYGVLASLFAVGLLGTVHCLGMCGGIVTALTLRISGNKPSRAFHLAYHAGRLTTYSAGGALAGGVGSAAALFGDFLPVQMVLYVAAQLMLVALGFYLLGITRVLRGLELGGAVLWRRVQPLAGRLLPVRSIAQAYIAGVLWGLLPCGLTYSGLATALTSGSPLGGALMMLAFGAGTLPGLLAAGALLAPFERLRRADVVRRAAGGAVIAFGLFGLAHAGHLQHLPGGTFFWADTQH